MGLLKNIFKKKPGGSVVGNLLRGVADKFTGGLASQIFKPKIAAGGIDQDELQKSIQNGIGGLLAQQQQKQIQTIVPGDLPQKESLMDKLKGISMYMWGGIAAALGLVYYFFIRTSKKGGYRRR